MKTINIIKLSFALAVIALVFAVNRLDAQSIKKALSEQSTTINKYVYSYQLSATEKKDIRYIIVIDANGNLKTCFDACYVCYQYDKGYTQKTNQLVCNNCGNRFVIADLDSEDTGGCYPVYLRHTIAGDSVSIDIADLQAGAYLFPTKAISSVSSSQSRSANYKLYCRNMALFVDFANSSKRNCRILDLNGKVCKSFNSDANGIETDLSELTEGAYLFSFEENGSTFSQVFYLNK